MTREECEKRIGELLKEIRDTVKEFNPEITILNMACGDNYSWAFSIDHENSTDYHQAYFLDVSVNHKEESEDE